MASDRSLSPQSPGPSLSPPPPEVTADEAFADLRRVYLELQAQRACEIQKIADGKQELELADTKIKHGRDEVRRIDSEIDRIKLQVREFTGHIFDLHSKESSLYTPNYELPSQSPQPSLNHEQRDQVDDLTTESVQSTPNPKRQRLALDQYTDESSVGEDDTDPSLMSPTPLSSEPRIQIVSTPQATRVERRTCAWFVAQVEEWICEKLSIGDLSMDHIQILSDTTLQGFNLGVYLYIVRLHKDIKQSPGSDLADYLADSHLVNLNKKERDGRCGLSHRTIKRIYQSYGVSDGPKIVAFHPPAGSVGNSVQVIFKALFEEPAAGVKRWPGQNWIYRKVITLCRDLLPPSAFSVYMETLRLRFPRFTSILPSLACDRIFKWAPSSSEVSRISGLTWYATCFDPKERAAGLILRRFQKGDKEQINQGQTQDPCERVGPDSRLTDADIKKLDSAAKNLRLCSETSLKSVRKMGTNFEIFDHAPLYGNLKVWDEPIASLVD